MRKYLVLLSAVTILLSGCTTPELVKTTLLNLTEEEPKPHYKVGNPYKVEGQWYGPYVPPPDEEFTETGMASWYGDDFHGKLTANGELFDKDQMTAAHKTLPLPSMVRITNLNNGRSALVRVNDRGPFIGNRIIDVSEKAARELGMFRKGVAKVKIKLDKEATAEMLEKEGYTKQAKYYEKKPKKFVQTGAYNVYGSAKKQTAVLKKVAPVKIETVNTDDKKLYRVKLGPFASAGQAGSVLNKVKKMGFDNAVIVTD